MTNLVTMLVHLQIYAISRARVWPVCAVHLYRPHLLRFANFLQRKNYRRLSKYCGVYSSKRYA